MIFVICYVGSWGNTVEHPWANGAFSCVILFQICAKSVDFSFLMFYSSAWGRTPITVVFCSVKCNKGLWCFALAYFLPVVDTLCDVTVFTWDPSTSLSESRIRSDILLTQLILKDSSAVSTQSIRHLVKIYLFSSIKMRKCFVLEKNRKVRL